MPCMYYNRVSPAVLCEIKVVKSWGAYITINQSINPGAIIMACCCDIEHAVAEWSLWGVYRSLNVYTMKWVMSTMYRGMAVYSMYMYTTDLLNNDQRWSTASFALQLPYNWFSGSVGLPSWSSIKVLATDCSVSVWCFARYFIWQPIFSSRKSCHVSQRT